MSTLRIASLVAATVAVGLAAGVFGVFSHTIMPGLRTTDDRTFVGTFQALDRAIINPWFMSTFLGSVLLTGLAAALHLGADHRRALPWILVALVLSILNIGVTRAVHLPLNNAIKAAGPPDRIADLAAVRRQFDEARWAAWNLVRTLASLLAFVALCVALYTAG